MSLNPALGSFYQTSDSSIDEIKQKKPKESWSLQTPDLIKTGTQHTGGNHNTLKIRLKKDSTQRLSLMCDSGAKEAITRKLRIVQQQMDFLKCIKGDSFYSQEFPRVRLKKY